MDGEVICLMLAVGTSASGLVCNVLQLWFPAALSWNLAIVFLWMSMHFSSNN